MIYMWIEKTGQGRKEGRRDGRTKRQGNKEEDKKGEEEEEEQKNEEEEGGEEEGGAVISALVFRRLQATQPVFREFSNLHSAH